MEKWYPVWGYHVQNYSPLPMSVDGLTQEIRVQSSISGKNLRLLLSNRYGADALTLSEITVGAGNHTCSLAVNGSRSVRLKPDEECYTDAVPLAVDCGSALTVRMKLSSAALCTGCVGFHSSKIARVAFFDETGAGVATETVSAAVKKGFSRFVCAGLCGIEISGSDAFAPAPTVIAVFGDSIVQQGHWYGSLHQKLVESDCGWTLYNEGISGNRVIRDNHSVSALNPIFGAAGVRRFEQDVYARRKPDIVLIAEGINDLVHPGNGCPVSELPEAEAIIVGLHRLRQIARENGSIPVIATLSPFDNYDGIWNNEREKTRQLVNRWVRAQENCVDIDRCVRDRENPCRLDRKYDSGDHLHLNGAAGAAAAEEIFRVLKESRRSMI